jgi:uncharacterized membrane protein
LNRCKLFFEQRAFGFPGFGAVIAIVALMIVKPG